MKSLYSGLTALVLVMVFSGAAMAQTAAAQKPSVNSTALSDLIANPKTKAVLDKDWPNYQNAPLSIVGGMTIQSLASNPMSQLDDGTIKKIQTDFDALGK